MVRESSKDSWFEKPRSQIRHRRVPPTTTKTLPTVSVWSGSSSSLRHILPTALGTGLFCEVLTLRTRARRYALHASAAWATFSMLSAKVANNAALASSCSRSASPSLGDAKNLWRANSCSR
jgi:hypothetical protein